MVKPKPPQNGLPTYIGGKVDSQSRKYFFFTQFCIRAVDPHSFFADPGPDPSVFLNPDPDPGGKMNLDPDPDPV